MTANLTLKNSGQDYINFSVKNNLILSVEPSNKIGWHGTQILNPTIRVGQQLEIRLHNGYECTLEPEIIEILPNFIEQKKP